MIVEEEFSLIEEILYKKDIREINAFFYYEDDELININDEKLYNDVHYIGEFQKLSYSDD